MKLKSISLSRLRIPLRLRFAQANSAAHLSDSVLIKAETKTGKAGFGESCPRTYVTGEDANSVLNDLVSLQTLLYEYTFNDIEDVRALTCYELPLHVGPAAICALELALLDALAKEKRQSVSQLLGYTLPDKLTYAGVVPFGKMDALSPILSRFSFREVKFKATADVGESLHRIQHLRTMYGPDVKLRLDANCGWAYREAREQIPVLAEAGIIAFEQLFPATELESLGRITAEFGDCVSIMADESICTYEQAEFLAENSLCNHFNLKLSKNGGILNCLRILELAGKHGIKCQLGAHYGETSVLTAAGIALAAAAPELTAQEGALGTLLLQQDICRNSVQINLAGRLFPPEHLRGNGLGVAFDWERVSAFLSKQSASAATA